MTALERPCCHCGETNRADASVCRYCHRLLDEQLGRSCPSCAEPIPSENPRCHFCGAVSQPNRPGTEPPGRGGSSPPPSPPSPPPSPPSTPPSSSPSTGPSGSVPPAPSRVPKKPIPPLKEGEIALPLPDSDDNEEELPQRPLVSPRKRKRDG